MTSCIAGVTADPVTWRKPTSLRRAVLAAAMVDTADTAVMDCMAGAAGSITRCSECTRTFLTMGFYSAHSATAFTAPTRFGSLPTTTQVAVAWAAVERV